MKVVHLITRADTVGGPHVSVRELCLFFEKQGHPSFVLVGQGGKGPYSEDLKKHGVPFDTLKHLIRPIHPWRDWLAFWEIRQALKRLCPDLLIPHGSKAAWLGRIAAKSLRIPVVFHVHGWSFTGGIPYKRRLFYLLLEKIAAPFTDVFLTVSEYDRQLGIRYKICQRRNSVTVYNGRPDIPKSLLAKPEKEPPTLVMVARFEEQKDHETLLFSLSQLLHLPWKLILVGEGPRKGEVQKLARQLGLEMRCQFTGFLPHEKVAEVLAKAQVSLLISHWEGFPCVLVESMRAGLPVVATDVGGTREAVEEGKTGYLIPPKDIATLKRVLSQLILKPELRKSMGEAGRKRYEAFFTLEKMCEGILRVCEAVEKKQWKS